MRECLPNKPLKNECGIMNLDDNSNSGTHWVSWIKNNNKVIYFDSFGNLKPPIEFIKYIGSINNIFYNYNNYQKYNTVICGHLCIQFLCNNKFDK